MKTNAVKIVELLLQGGGVPDEIIGAVRTVVLRDSLVCMDEAARVTGRCRATVMRAARENEVPVLMRRSRLGAMVDLDALMEVMG